MANELSARYAKLVDAKLRQVLVTKDNYVFNNRYEGTPAGGSVKIPVRADMVASTYDKENGKTLASGNTKYVTVVMKDIAVSELIDGFDAAAVPDNIVADRLDSAGYGLGLFMDTDGIKCLVYAAAGKDEDGTAFPAGDARNGQTGTVVATAPTASTIYKQILEMKKVHDKAGVPKQDRFIIASPDAVGFMLQDSNFIKECDLSQELLEAGAVGKIAGYNVFEASDLGNDSASHAVYFIGGHPDFCTRVKEWSVEPRIIDIRDGKYIGASAVQGRQVYRHAVTQPKAIYIVTANA